MSDVEQKPPRDWSGFVQRIYISRDKEDLWPALATPEGLTSWFTCRADMTDAAGRRLSSDAFPAVGFGIHWEWAEGTIEEATVLEIEPRDRMRFTWYGDKGWVEFRLRENEGRNYVEIEQRMEKGDLDFFQDVYVGCAQGWAFFLANLKSVVEGGMDLREYKADIGALVNV